MLGRCRKAAENLSRQARGATPVVVPHTQSGRTRCAGLHAPADYLHGHKENGVVQPWQDRNDVQCAMHVDNCSAQRRRMGGVLTGGRAQRRCCRGTTAGGPRRARPPASNEQQRRERWPVPRYVPVCEASLPGCEKANAGTCAHCSAYIMHSPRRSAFSSDTAGAERSGGQSVGSRAPRYLAQGSPMPSANAPT